MHETWLTAFQLLFMVGQVKAGDTVLLHAAASGWASRDAARWPRAQR